ncbi:MAG: 50S ribosomal protein L7Ae [Candidatus Bathyarchaeia archaeon]
MSKRDVDPSKPFYVKFEVPKEVAEAAYEALKIATETGKTRRGANETTKSIERGRSKLTVIAENVEPPEVVAHIPLLCEERKAPYVYVPDKRRIGESIGLNVAASTASIEEAGDAEGLINEIVSKLKGIVK